MNYSEMTLGDLADLYREKWDRQEDLQDQAAVFGKEAEEIKGHILRRMEAQSLDSLKTDRITLSVKEICVPKVTNWEQVQKWMADQGRWEFMRKQLNTKPFEEMVERGEELPPGTEIQFVKNLNRFRKK